MISDHMSLSEKVQVYTLFTGAIINSVPFYS